MCPEVVNSQSLLLICLVMLRPIHTRNCGMSTLFAPISKWKGSTHLKIRANLFPVRTYWGHCHYSGSKHNTFEVWRWSGGWRGPSRWAKGLLRAVEWERKEDASQQGQPDENVWVGGCQQPTNTRVGLHRSGGGGANVCGHFGNLFQQTGLKSRDPPKPQQPYLCHLSICYHRVFFQWVGWERVHTNMQTQVSVCSAKRLCFF